MVNKNLKITHIISTHASSTIVYNIPTGASRITLKIDAGATDEYDHATWANAGFIQ
ncbi:MAG: hypothetical protein II359_07535 [Clostridia bacterium]|nr:hypothetical protein [Clostridia bacterium]